MEIPVDVKDKSKPIILKSRTNRPYYTKIGQDFSYPTFAYNGHKSLVLNNCTTIANSVYTANNR